MRTTTFSLLVSIFLLFSGCVQFKTNPVFSNMDEASQRERSFFTADVIYSDVRTSESWNTKAPDCITVENTKRAAYKGNAGLHVKWNRLKQGCPLLLMGFGWDNWTGKDMSHIRNTGAISFYVRMVQGERKSLPMAVGLEDYAGRQAWLGISKEAVLANSIGEEWVQVLLPLSEFDWFEQGAKPDNIKQLIMTFDADGELFIDEIRVIPYTGGFRKRAVLPLYSGKSLSPSLDESSVVWQSPAIEYENTKVHMVIAENQLYLSGVITSEENQLDRLTTLPQEMFNASHLEIAFGTDVTANPKRVRMMMSDVYLGLRFGENYGVMNLRDEKMLDNAQVLQKRINDVIHFSVKIDIDELQAGPLLPDELYRLEFGTNTYDSKLEKKQVRWNDADNHDFSGHPARWGEFMLKDKKLSL